MSATTATPADSTLANLAGLLPDLEALYKDIHAHPELSMQETRTRASRRSGCARPATT